MLVLFVLGVVNTIKSIFLLLIPSVTLLVSACAVGPPSGPAYGYGYGPGPDPRDGYYWNGAVYVEGSSPYHHHYGQYNGNENDVDVNRLAVNDRTVNDTTVNDRTVNRTNVNQTDISRTNVKARTERNPVEKTERKPEERKSREGNQQGNQPLNQ